MAVRKWKLINNVLGDTKIRGAGWFKDSNWPVRSARRLTSMAFPTLKVQVAMHYTRDITRRLTFWELVLTIRTAYYEFLIRGRPRAY